MKNVFCLSVLSLSLIKLTPCEIHAKLCKLLAEESETKVKPARTPSKITTVFKDEPSTIKKQNPTDPMQTRYVGDLADVIDEGMLPLSYMELYLEVPSSKHLTSTLIPEQDNVIRSNLTAILN